MRILSAAAVVGCTCLMATPALADRPPTAKERAAIEKVLKANGFTRWEEIELDDDGPYWDVDDARTANRADGKVDIRIDPRTLKIIKRQRDD